MNKKLLLNLSSKEIKVVDPTPEEIPMEAIIDKADVPKSYPGGKGGPGVYQTIINMIPPHDTYIETHLGAGSIMKYKKPAVKNIGIDIDQHVIDTFSCSITKSAGGSGYNFVCGDAVQSLENYFEIFPPDEEKAFIYCDPPYMMSTRKGGKLYDHEYNTDDHIRLLNTIKGLTPDCMIMISGYYHPMYEEILTGWNSKQYQASTRAGMVTEWMWYNYPDPLQLHDYRYLGNDFRDRERIKRKIKRWKRKIDSLPALERNAIMEELCQKVN